MVLNGPNLDLLGEREKDVYGSISLEEIERMMREAAARMGIEVDFFQSNHEGELIDRVHAARSSCQGIIINPGALTHYSYALYDALKAAEIPVIEVHLSNIYGREEEWRKRSVISPAARGVISGLGPLGYLLALEALEKMVGEG
jgi:3-dehydroquinate dehydratase-2